MLACVRCGACLTSCPTYLLTGNEAEGPRGRIAMIRAWAEGQVNLTPDLLAHEQSCLVCDACSSVCPASVRMEPLQVAFRAALAGRRQAGLGERFVQRALFRHMVVFRAVARMVRFYQRSGLQWVARHTGLLRLLGLAEMEGLLPKVAGRFVVANGQTRGKGGSAVSFFAGCIMSTALADIDEATIRVLERAGCEVGVTAGQGCCGALNTHGGDAEGAVGMARKNIAAFEGDGTAPVVVNSAGCGAMLKEYGHLLAGDPEWAERACAFSRRVVDMTEYLAGRELPLHAIEGGPVTYQDACHLANAQGIRQQPRALLQAIPGLELRDLKDGGLCCGSAGVYNVTHRDMAGQLQARKVEAILATGASTVVTANPGCLLQVRAGLAKAGANMQVKHIVELLDEATRP